MNGLGLCAVDMNRDIILKALDKHGENFVKHLACKGLTFIKSGEQELESASACIVTHAVNIWNNGAPKCDTAFTNNDLLADPGWGEALVDNGAVGKALAQGLDAGVKPGEESTVYLVYVGHVEGLE